MAQGRYRVNTSLACNFVCGKYDQAGSELKMFDNFLSFDSIDAATWLLVLTIVRMLRILESVKSGEYFYLSCHKHPTATMVGGLKGFHYGY